MIDKLEKFHFIGIGGSGMSGLAKILLEMGCKVSGSDITLSETTDNLTKLGANIFSSHSTNNITKETDYIVVSTAIKQDNVEIFQGKVLGIPILHRSDVLKMIIDTGKGICVAGSHGKTTTTSMIIEILNQAGFEPTVYIGGYLTSIDGNAKFGTGEYVVAEADESDGTFLKYQTYIAVVTNIDDDHLDFYGNFAGLTEAFFEFLCKNSLLGFKVLCIDDAQLYDMSLKFENVITYSINQNAQYSARNINISEIYTEADIYVNEKFLTKIELHVPGKHNLSNGLAAFTVAHKLGIETPQIVQTLKNFSGARRRFQYIGEVNGIRIIDDYAHHPTEIAVTLAAAKQLKPNKLWVIFQPHRYTRTRQFMEKFSEALSLADRLILSDIFAASEEPITDIDSYQLSLRAKEKGIYVEYIKEIYDIPKILVDKLMPGDIVLTVGAGTVTKLGPIIKDLLEKRYKYGC
ncbi:MAG: UDP-N-acetylmuramate--L-alanine ligase [Clostridia bacterium]